VGGSFAAGQGSFDVSGVAGGGGVGEAEQGRRAAVLGLEVLVRLLQRCDLYAGTYAAGQGETHRLLGVGRLLVMWPVTLRACMTSLSSGSAAGSRRIRRR
jgi:hypothetical protein